MAKRTRVSISIDADLLEFAQRRAAIRKISVAEQLRWTLRDGMFHRQELERQYKVRIGMVDDHGR